VEVVAATLEAIGAGLTACGLGALTATATRKVLQSALVVGWRDSGSLAPNFLDRCFGFPRSALPFVSVHEIA
jgi:hypothetical protein